MDKKRSFWILLLIFGLLTVAFLVINQATMGTEGGEMGLSMGGMMKMHHANQLTPAALLYAGGESSLEAEENSGHHSLAPLMESISFLTTASVFLFLPLLLGGSVLLLVLWL